jgi:hypothetical protein
MSRQMRRKMEREQLSNQRKIRSLQQHIIDLRMQGVLPFPKPSLWQRIKMKTRSLVESFLVKRLNR